MILAGVTRQQIGVGWNQEMGRRHDVTQTSGLPFSTALGNGFSKTSQGQPCTWVIKRQFISMGSVFPSPHNKVTSCWNFCQRAFFVVPYQKIYRTDAMYGNLNLCFHCVAFSILFRPLDVYWISKVLELICFSGCFILNCPTCTWSKWEKEKLSSKKWTFRCISAEEQPKRIIRNVVFVFRVMAVKLKFMCVDVLYCVYLNK
jgi:hypothetical protein